MDTVHAWELPDVDGVAMQLLRDASAEGDTLARGTLAWVNKTRKELTQSRVTTVLDREDLQLLSRFQRATRMSRRIILKEGLKLWGEKHCPPESLSGVEIACGERQEKLLAAILQSESVREPELLPSATEKETV
jgi:hypothetical protein